MRNINMWIRYLREYSIFLERKRFSVRCYWLFTSAFINIEIFNLTFISKLLENCFIQFWFKLLLKSYVYLSYVQFYFRHIIQMLIFSSSRKGNIFQRLVSDSFKQKWASFWFVTFRSELVYPLCFVNNNCPTYHCEYYFYIS